MTFWGASGRFARLWLGSGNGRKKASIRHALAGGFSVHKLIFLSQGGFFGNWEPAVALEGFGGAVSNFILYIDFLRFQKATLGSGKGRKKDPSDTHWQGDLASTR